MIIESRIVVSSEGGRVKWEVVAEFTHSSKEVQFCKIKKF
jgi:hypothetical protein